MIAEVGQGAILPSSGQNLKVMIIFGPLENQKLAFETADPKECINGQYQRWSERFDSKECTMSPSEDVFV